MPPQALADADIAAPPVFAVKRPEGQVSAAAALTADLIRRARTSADPRAEMDQARPEPAPVAAPAPAPSTAPTASATPPDAVAPAPAADLVAVREETPSAARALRRDLNAARRSGGVARSVGLFVVIYAVACLLMIYALV